MIREKHNEKSLYKNIRIANRWSVREEVCTSFTQVYSWSALPNSRLACKCIPYACLHLSKGLLLPFRGMENYHLIDHLPCDNARIFVWHDIHHMWPFGACTLLGRQLGVMGHPRASPAAVGRAVQAGILQIEQGLYWLYLEIRYTARTWAGCRWVAQHEGKQHCLRPKSFLFISLPM